MPHSSIAFFISGKILETESSFNLHSDLIVEYGFPIMSSFSVLVFKYLQLVIESMLWGKPVGY